MPKRFLRMREVPHLIVSTEKEEATRVDGSAKWLRLSSNRRGWDHLRRAEKSEPKARFGLAHLCWNLTH